MVKGTCHSHIGDQSLKAMKKQPEGTLGNFFLGEGGNKRIGEDRDPSKTVSPFLIKKTKF